MTIGSTTRDSRFNVPGVQGLVGPRTSKTWNGADYPKVKNTRPPVRLGTNVSTFSVWKHGKVVTVSRIKRFRIYEPRSYLPRRARVEEHPYTMSRTYQYDAAWCYLPPYSHLCYSTEGAGYTGYGTQGSTGVSALVALGRLREAIAGSDFNAGVSLAESRQAFNMITSSATKIYKAYRKVRRGDVFGAAHALTGRRPSRAPVSKDIASNWLQLQYGWLPLLKDVENAAQFLAHHYNTPLQKVVKVYAKTRENGVLACTSPSNVQPLKTVFEQKTKIKAILREKDIVALSGITDPLSIAWELTPYSFVVDWFIPIGNWLQARALASSLTGTFVTSTWARMSMKGMKGISTMHPDVPGYVWDRIDFTRTVGSSLSIPLPEFKSFGKAASVKHCINAVALLVNRAVK